MHPPHKIIIALCFAFALCFPSGLATGPDAVVTCYTYSLYSQVIHTAASLTTHRRATLQAIGFFVRRSSLDLI